MKRATKQMISELTAVKNIQQAMKQARRPRWIRREGYEIKNFSGSRPEDLMEKKAAGGQQPEKI